MPAFHRSVRSSRRPISSCLTALLAFVAGGCSEEGGLLVDDRGNTPIAVARVLGRDGAQVTIDYEGNPVSVTLDASRSSDADGRIVAYRWLSGEVATLEEDGGSPGGRAVAEGADLDWPDDKVRPKVELDQGQYAFVLWVTDDSGVTSDPDLVRVDVRPAEAGESEP